MAVERFTARNIIFEILVFILLSLSLVSCSADQEILKASQALEKAKGAHAEYLAPYEFTSVEIYLSEARLQARKSDFGRASRYAIKAADFAAKALVIAEKKQILTAPVQEKKP